VNSDYVVAVCSNNEVSMKAPTIVVIDVIQASTVASWVCPLPEISAVAINNSVLVAFTYERGSKTGAVSVYDVLKGTALQSVALPCVPLPAAIVDAYIDNESNLFYWGRNQAYLTHFCLHTESSIQYVVDRVGKNCVRVDPNARIRCDIE
jgi:hypothetical protein